MELEKYPTRDGWILLDRRGNLFSIAINQLETRVVLSKEVKNYIKELRKITIYYPRRTELLPVHSDLRFFQYLLSTWGLKKSNTCGETTYFLVGPSAHYRSNMSGYGYIKPVLDSYLSDLEIG